VCIVDCQKFSFFQYSARVRQTHRRRDGHVSTAYIALWIYASRDKNRTSLIIIITVIVRTIQRSTAVCVAGSNGSFLCQLSGMDELRGTVVSSPSLQPPPHARLTSDKNFFGAETSAAVGRHDGFTSVGQRQPQPAYSAAQPVTVASWWTPRCSTSSKITEQSGLEMTQVRLLASLTGIDRCRICRLGKTPMDHSYKHQKAGASRGSGPTFPEN